MNTSKEFLVVPNTFYNCERLRRMGVLKQCKYFICCKKKMSLIKDSNSLDGEIFKCNVCKRKLSIRTDSIFFKLKMSLHKIFQTIDLWLEETKIDTASKLLNLSKPTIVKLYKKFREVLSYYFVNNLERLDENSNTLQLKEMLISDEKYHKGKKIEQKCVIGIIDTVTKDVLIKHIDSRDREKLKSVIFDAITEPSTMSTDIWKEYLNVFDDVIIDYDDLNTSDNIKQLVDKADNDAISNVWFHLRNTLKKRSQTNYNNLQGYIDEFLWRRKLKNDKEDMINSFLELSKVNVKNVHDKNCI